MVGIISLYHVIDLFLRLKAFTPVPHLLHLIATRLPPYPPRDRASPVAAGRLDYVVSIFI